MKDRFFLDTNIFVYSFSSANNSKCIKSQELIEHALSSGLGVISYQVVQEFLNVGFKKFSRPFESEEALLMLSKILIPLCAINSSSILFARALDVRERYKFTFYDSIIVAGALESECRVLYSEDLQHNQKVEKLTVINPFI